MESYVDSYTESYTYRRPLDVNFFVVVYIFVIYFPFQMRLNFDPVPSFQSTLSSLNLRHFSLDSEWSVIQE
jgi:hypothetical protein